ncbi:FAD-dependent monooxygenase [Nonomuraea soli]|uniref:2-polyprenyl-6-methoxyphenol hydroxylase-like FAD-dependent oxidoreductase n=1 Tax=Nonomuraea soli TaxID=1032476 RepID=A0A7W0CT34_9ACTN|nr:FAD-dependent monooxygenase [Nonomuraea soli]MBA2896822.1 2-polyprenyl-6-methoxyphenol hydroxylase-like FAD-dependent oxidoreductase [Nonomuraea soli]
MRVLISGASIAGPVAAYWLARHGFEVTVVERAPTLRKTGGHAVDLFRPALEIAERMGVAEAIEARRTGITTMIAHRRGRRPVTVGLGKIYRATSSRHVEIMRDDLSEIFYEAAMDDVEYLFGDSISSIDDRTVTFESGASREFDLVIGADGLHSNTRRLLFGQVEEHFTGACLAVFTVSPDTLEPATSYAHLDPGRVAVAYRSGREARAGFFFHSEPLEIHHRDTASHKRVLLERFAGLHPQVDGWLDELGATPAFYFDAITQLRLDTWSKGRVALVGDAGYCPGPAIGGSTSLAVYSAYVLAGELARTPGDHERAFAAYADEIRELVRRSRAFAMGAAKALVPGSRLGVAVLVGGARLVSVLPPALSRALATRNLRVHDSMTVKDYSSSVRAGT